MGNINSDNEFVPNYIVYFNKNITYNCLDIININFQKGKFFENIYYSNYFPLNNFINCFIYKLNYDNELQCIKNIIISIDNFEKKIYICNNGIRTFKNIYLIKKKIWII